MKLRVSKKLSVLIGSILIAVGGVLTGHHDTTDALLGLVPAIVTYLGIQGGIDLAKVLKGG